MILITGASSGIGEACARLFCNETQTKGLILVARRVEKLKKLKRELEKQNSKISIHVIALDISKKKNVVSVAKKYAKLFSKVEVLVNNAGVAHGLAKLQDGDPSDWDLMIDTNVKGLLYMTHVLIPHFTAKNCGHIVNLGSVAGHWVYLRGNVYCATKHAVKALNEGLRMDLAGTKVRVTAISPGMVETEFSVVRLGDQKKADAVYKGMTPLRAVDIAEAVVWAVQRPQHVNIQDIVIYPTDQASPTQVTRKE